MKRIVSLDYLRILSCILVIGIHGMGLLSPEDNPKSSLILYTVVNHIVRLGLPLFFMLSSVALAKPIDILSNLKEFYLKKFLSLYVPFFMWSVYYYERSNNLLNSFPEMLLNIPKALYCSLKEPQWYHMWYMYTLIGLILLEPFLKRMLDNLDYKELFWLCNILLIAKALSIFRIVKIEELYFGSWIIYYIIGSFLIREETRKYTSLIIFLSFLMFFVAVGIDFYFTESVFLKYIFDYSPIIVIQAGGIFSLFLWIEKVRKPVSRKIVKYLSKFTFQIYLAHPAIKNYVVYKLGFLKDGLLSDYPLLFFIVAIIMTFLCSALVAAIIEGIILIGYRRQDSYPSQLGL